MTRELLIDFYQSTHKLKPKHILISRDGVSESMFDHVLNIELEQIMQNMDDSWTEVEDIVVAMSYVETRHLCRHATMDAAFWVSVFHMFYRHVGETERDVNEVETRSAYLRCMCSRFNGRVKEASNAASNEKKKVGN
ncbi:putative Piwi domain, ribonuclease H-like superfamily [Helianthus debilis subsp. tardiflorus]